MDHSLWLSQGPPSICADKQRICGVKMSWGGGQAVGGEYLKGSLVGSRMKRRVRNTAVEEK